MDAVSLGESKTCPLRTIYIVPPNEVHPLRGSHAQFDLILLGFHKE